MEGKHKIIILALIIIIVALSSILFYILRDKDEAKLKKLRKQEIRAARKGL